MDDPSIKHGANVFGEFFARLRRTIWKDICLLNTLSPAEKIICSIFGIALIVIVIIVIVWWPGLAWWTTQVNYNYSTRTKPRYELPLVFLAISVLLYIVHAIDRSREK